MSLLTSWALDLLLLFFKDSLSLFLSVGAVLLVSEDSDSISLLALFSVSDLSVMYSWNDFDNGQVTEGH